MILRDQISDERFDRYITAMKNQKNDDWGTYDAANLSDISLNAMYIGILTEDSDLLSRIKEKLGETMFSYTDSGNGWYPDGSYVDHSTMAYTGGYGSVLISAMEKMMPIVKGTAYEMSYGDERDDFYNTVIFTGYLPLLPNGRIVDMVSGRSITRKPNENRNSAGQMAVFADALDEEESLACKSLVKGWLLEDPTILSNLTKPAELMACKKILDDDSIVAAQPENGYYRYTNMDKVAQRTENYLVGLSMHSQRIVNCENINGEGKRLWNVSDGALYLYDSDTEQYKGDFWPTVDLLRLPGSTTLYDTSRIDTAGFNTKNPNDWVGGTDMGNIGIAGMEINTIGTGNSRNGVHAQKSYFMFDNEIVALGSDINSSLNLPVETVIENKKIQDDLSNRLTFNGEEKDLSKGESRTVNYLQVLSTSKLSKVHQLERALPEDAATIQATVKMRFADSSQGAALRFYGLDDNGNSVLIATAELRDSGSDKGIRMWGQTGSPYIVTDEHKREWITFTVNLDLEEQTIGFKATDENGQDITNRTDFTLMGGVHIAKPSKLAFYNMNTLANERVDVANISIGADGAEPFEVIDFNETTAEELLQMEGWRSARVDAAGTLIDTALESNFKVTTQSYEVPGEDPEITDVNWAHLEGNVEGSDVGYYFPQATTVKAFKETRTGEWKDLNALQNWGHDALDPVTRGYATMYIDHGNQPSGAGYEYVMLPGMSEEETQAYHDNPDIEIVENSDAAHAVREKKLNVLGVNFWNKESKSVDVLTSSTQASVMLKETDSTYELSLTDPTGTNKDSIELTIALPSNAVLEKSDEITVVSMDEVGATIRVDLSNAELGKKFTMTVRKGALNTSELETKVEEAEQISSDNYTAGSYSALQAAIADAKQVLADAVSQEEIDACRDVLQAAIDALVDISGLKTAYDKHMLVSNENATYTTGSFAAFADARDAAKAVLDNANATKEEVASAITQMDEAKAALVNITTLRYVINLANGHVEAGDLEGLVPSAVEEFNKALEEANTVYADANATEEQVDAAWKKLMNVIHGLGFEKGDKTALTELVNTAKALDLVDYQDGAEKTAFETALSEAEAVLTDPDAMKADIDAAYTKLREAMDALIPVPAAGDKSELQKVYDEASAYDLNKYVDDKAAKDAFATALGAAKAVLEKEDAQQSEIDEAWSNLLTAMSGLRLRADKSSLEEWIENLKSIDLSLYTEESANAVRLAIAEAEALAAQDLGQDQIGLIQAAIVKMENAKLGLQLSADVSGDDNNSSDPSSKEETSSPSENSTTAGGKTPTTGDSAPIAAISLLAIAAAGVLLGLKKRK